MTAHLEVNNLLCKNQHGFRSGKSCLTQLLHHFDDIIDSLANGDDVDAIYLDYAKAFDKVDHKLLINKLQLYGFHPKIIKWIESFLTGRTQKVVVDGHMSGPVSPDYQWSSPRYSTGSHSVLDLYQRYNQLCGLLNN